MAQIEALRFMRFSMVGLVSGFAYAVVVVLAIELVDVDAIVANILGYLVAIPTNFIGQRKYVFRSNGKIHKELFRFLLVQFANMIFSSAVMYFCVVVLSLPYAIGIILVILTIPVSTYFCLKVLVFVSYNNSEGS